MKKEFSFYHILFAVLVGISIFVAIYDILFRMTHKCVESHYTVQRCGRYIHHACLKTVCDKWERK